MAQDLLLNPALTLEQIAVRCGFADQSHLSRVFAAFVGTAPGEWRRQRRLVAGRLGGGKGTRLWTIVT
jgi:transcriptional regulator GlxA family with amidase domain